MKKKIYYWSPCLNPVGTVKSTINSAVAAVKYSKNTFDVSIINACGEWDEYDRYLRENNVKIINFKLKIFNKLPKQGYFQSRISYMLIFIASFFPLYKLLKNHRPEFFIAHLITSLPLTLMKIFNFKTKFILRISGKPNLNFIRKTFWSFASNKLHIVTCPTDELKEKILKINIFSKEKVHLLHDAIIDVKKFFKDIKENVEIPKNFKEKKVIFAAGRLTKQKNFNYLIDEFANFTKKNNDYTLCILGEGEERETLEKKINQKQLNEKVCLLGFVNNVFKYFKKGDLFVLSSIWEDPGFVLVEAALCNLFVISSNCPNGPKEILNYGENGILFQSNKPGELEKGLKKYSLLKNTFLKRVRIKKSIRNYTKFKHYTNLSKILSY